MTATAISSRAAGLILIACAVLACGCRHGSNGLARSHPLVEVSGFGSNPGALQMFRYVPSSRRAKSALVIALHGCAQNAQDYADHSGWAELATKVGFLVVFPQQSLTNNPVRCFNWFEAKNNRRDSGEALSIEQMVERMKTDYQIDAKRIYVTGLSAGGAMTSVMLATYPDLFAGGAIMSGVPYGCATKLNQSFSCMQSTVEKAPKEWGDLVRSASSSKSWPIVSIWHGTADNVVAPINAQEETEQWTDVQGVSQLAFKLDKVGGYPHQTFSKPDGRAVVEVYSITNMGHGQAINPGVKEEQCGVAESFFPDVHICAAYYACKFWGLIH